LEEVVLGEPVDADMDVGLAIATGIEVWAWVYEGSEDIWSKELRRTKRVERVGKVRNYSLDM
jgi:hypothetical protein